MFVADQVPMCMAVTATIFLFPAADAVAGSGGGSVSYRFDMFFKLFYLYDCPVKEQDVGARDIMCFS